MTGMDRPEQEKSARGGWVSRSQALGAILMAAAVVIGLGVIVIRQNRAGSGVEIIRAAEQGPLYRVDVNRAEAPDLMLLPGIGEVRAERILKARRENGPFASFEAFGKAAGLSESQLAEIQKVATLGDPNGEGVGN
jgi:competence protein ComEA